VPLPEANRAAKNRTVAALTFLAGKSAIQPASRLDGKPAGKGAASSYDLRYGGQLTCL